MDWLILLATVATCGVGIMLARNLCCCDPCIIREDDFSSDWLATKYAQTAGSWSVGSGVLTTSDADAQLDYATAMSGEMVKITATATCASTSDTARVHITNGVTKWYVEVQPGATNGTMKLIRETSGTPTRFGPIFVIPGLNAGESFTLSLCYGPTIAGINGATANVVFGGTTYTYGRSDTLLPGGTTGMYAGMSTGAVSSSVTFDDFSIVYHGDTSYYDDTSGNRDDCPICEPSGCYAFIKGTEPASFTVTLSSGFTNAVGCTTCAATYNGASYTVTPTEDCSQTNTVSGGGCVATGTVEVDFTLGTLAGAGTTNHIYMTVQVGDGTVSMIWEVDLGDTQLDGTTFSSVANVSGWSGCNATGTTATVSV